MTQLWRYCWEVFSSSFFIQYYNTTVSLFVPRSHKIQFLIMISGNCMEEIQHSARLNILFCRCQDIVSLFNTVFSTTFEIHISSQWRGSDFTLKYYQFILLYLFLRHRRAMKQRNNSRQEKTMCRLILIINLTTWLGTYLNIPKKSFWLEIRMFIFVLSR